jgi:hypothetical protein
MVNGLLTIVETRAYLARADKLLDEDAREGIKVEIATDPECGVVMRGTGGVRKFRFAVGNRGQSAGVRVVYYFCNERMPAFLLTVFAKNEKDNLSKEERNNLAKLVNVLREQYGESHGR